MDAALNFYFIYVVKKRLIANGLQKYTRLYQMNSTLVAISIALDVLLICMMSLPDSFVYIQFHPLVYLLKLHIEMNMADLIGKVVQASNTENHDYSSRSWGNGTARQYTSRFGHILANTQHRTHIEIGQEDEYGLQEREKIRGIKKTVVTQVTHSGPSENDDDSHEDEEIDDREISESSSTKQLQSLSHIKPWPH
ncbi:hypothetical protein CDV31_017346 [Fusarium ambrosium]|uniref:Uncharacterized protein n=1 Tax=Fusarium ambrosium TaxID=131363 RepID=A0A428RHV2_9HYPO|nr:hypothetical protein CDV31_017346 [Fusarium ambrosium]